MTLTHCLLIIGLVTSHVTLYIAGIIAAIWILAVFVIGFLGAINWLDVNADEQADGNL
jgi:hypothetical protein